MIELECFQPCTPKRYAIELKLKINDKKTSNIDIFVDLLLTQFAADAEDAQQFFSYDIVQKIRGLFPKKSMKND